MVRELIDSKNCFEISYERANFYKEGPKEDEKFLTIKMKQGFKSLFVLI